MLKNNHLILFLCITCLAAGNLILANELPSKINKTHVGLYAGINWNNPNDNLIAQRIFNRIEQKLSRQLIFNRIAATHTRSWLHLKNNDTGCIFNVIDTPSRREKAHFSKYPVYVSPPLRFFTSTNSAFVNPFTFSQLDHTVISNKIAVVENRFYSHVINNFISSHPQYFYIHSSIDRSDRFLGMLQKGRIKGFIDFSESIRAASNVTNIKFDIRTLTIEGEKEYTTGYFACSKTKSGKEVIKLINIVMGEKAFREWMIKEHQRFYGEQEAKALIPHLIDTIYN